MKSERDDDVDEKDCGHALKASHSTCSLSMPHDNNNNTAEPSDPEPCEQSQISQPPHPDLSRAPSRRSAASTKSHVGNFIQRVLTTRSIADPGPPPDGGVKAWTQVLCASFVVATTWGFINSFGVFESYYESTLPQSPSTISWIGTICNFLTFFLSGFAGRALDAGLFRPMFVIGLVLQALGIFLTSLCTEYWQLILTQGVLVGIGSGIVFIPPIGIVASYFDKSRALAMGFVTAGNSVGGIVYPILVRELIPTLGFAWTIRVLGFLNLALLIFVLAFIRPRLPPRKQGPVLDLKAFTEPAYATLVTGLFFDIWAIYYTFYYIASFGIDETGLSFNNSTNLVIIINGIGIPARIIPPYLADRYGQLNIMVPTVLSLASVAFCWLAVHKVAGIYVFTCFYGLASGSFQCLIPSTVSKLTPRMDMMGTRIGMAFTVMGFAALTGSPIGGAIQHAQHGQYWGASLFAALSTAIAACFVIATRWTLVGTKVSVKI